jgi:hypothetical protein
MTQSGKAVLNVRWRQYRTAAASNGLTPFTPLQGATVLRRLARLYEMAIQGVTEGATKCYTRCYTLESPDSKDPNRAFERMQACASITPEAKKTSLA